MDGWIEDDKGEIDKGERSQKQRQGESGIPSETHLIRSIR